MLSAIEVAAVAAVAAELGEGPCWDAATGTLLFVDITPGVVYRYHPRDGSTSSLGVGQEVGAAIPRSAGGLVLALRDGVAVVAAEDDTPEVVAPIEAENQGNRINDAKCDPRGRLWAGTMAFDFAPGAAGLYRIDPDHRFTRVLDGATIANGLGWSPDGTQMYFIESGENAVDVFDYDVERGVPTRRRRLITVPRELGMPDGMAIDAEGCLWIAMYGGGRVQRFSPHGDAMEAITLPVTQVTSAAFGGDDLGDLYITSAAQNLDEEARRAQPLAGATFVCRPGVSGLPVAAFAG